MVEIELSSLQKGLVGHWPLDELHYNPATKRHADLSPYCNHGTGAVSAVFAPDRMGGLGGACSFDGVSDYITIPFVYTMDAYTFVFWQEPDHSKMSIGSYPLHVYKFGESSWTDPISEWYHGKGIHMTGRYQFCVTWDGATQKLYVNNIERASRPHVGVCNFNTALYLGQYGESGYEYCGPLEDVRIYNRELNTQERTALYETYHPGVRI